MTNEAVAYTDRELIGYLPSGWNLAEEAEDAQWNARKGTWTLTVTDGAETDWPIVVKAKEVAKHGRLEALRQAMDRVYREALG